MRGDRGGADGGTENKLRQWEKTDFVAHPDDILQERLYCIQWITRETLGKGRQATFFARVSDEDLARERKVEELVRESISHWQADGLAPDMPIEPGDETTRLIRERGLTYWDNVFDSRQVLGLSILRRAI